MSLARGQRRPYPRRTLVTHSITQGRTLFPASDDTISRTKTTVTNPTKTNSACGEGQPSGVRERRVGGEWARGRPSPGCQARKGAACGRPCSPPDPRAAQQHRVPHRAFADLHVQLVPFSRTPRSRGTHTQRPAQAHGVACRAASERSRGPEHLGRGRRSEPARLRGPRLLPSPSPTSQPPSPAAAALRAGWGGAGGGPGWRAAPAQKAESPGGGARAVRGAEGAAETARGNPDRRSPSSSPGRARPSAMEFLWAPLLGLCCSLAAADRHTVFWNSSNPK